MRVGTLTVGLLAGAVICITGLAAPAQTNSGKVSIPMTTKAQDKTAPAVKKPPANQAQAQPQAKPLAKRSVKSAKRLAARKAAARRAAIRHAKRQRANFYDYASAQPVHPGGWRQAWLAHRGMRDAHYAPPPPPAAYGPPPAYYEESGIEIDRQGWTGGVGYGTSGDFVDGYGMMHYGWNNRQNGPTYNSFNQSFQHNPSVARPFQPRRMGHPIPSR
jgi:hypothetical protein